METLTGHFSNYFLKNNLHLVHMLCLQIYHVIYYSNTSIVHYNTVFCSGGGHNGKRRCWNIFVTTVSPIPVKLAFLSLSNFN